MTAPRDGGDRNDTVDGDPIVVRVPLVGEMYTVCRSATSPDTLRVYAPANGAPRRTLVCTITGTAAPEASWHTAAYRRPNHWRDALVAASVSAVLRTDTRHEPPDRPPAVWEFRPSGA